MDAIELRDYDNSWYYPGRSSAWRIAWLLFGSPLLRCSWVTSSWLRINVLRLFGAQIGQRVVMRQPFRVKFPWNLVVGDDSWFGEECWIDNLTTVTIGHNVCLSQGAYLCTGNHDWSDPHFGLRVGPIRLEDGSWAGAHCLLTPGVVLEVGAVAAAGSVVTTSIPRFEVYQGNPATFVKRRVLRTASPLSEKEQVHS